MTDYAGTVAAKHSSAVPRSATNQFATTTHTEFSGTIALTGLRRTDDGGLAGSFAAAGTVTTTVRTQIDPLGKWWLEQVDVTTSSFDIPATPYASAADLGIVPGLAAALGIGGADAHPFWIPGSGGTVDDFASTWEGAGLDPAPWDDRYQITIAVSRTSPVWSIDWLGAVDPANPNVFLPYPSEGDTGVTLLPFDILRDRGLDRAASIAWWVEPSDFRPAGPEDFAGGAFPSGIASFAPGEASRRIAIPVAGDGALEWDEGYIVRIAVPADEFLHGTERRSGALINDDAALIVSVSLMSQHWIEGDPAGYVFTVERSGNINQTSVIDWSVQGAGPRGATAGHFAGGVFPHGTLTLAPGQAAATIHVAAADDPTPGPSRDVYIEARPAAALADIDLPPFNSVLAWALIADNDGPPDPAEIAATTQAGPLPAMPRWYDGPVHDLQKEIILLDQGDITLVATTPNWFLRTGPGNDAIAAAGGINVIDGGTGSNFLSGQGTDTFFVDARGLAAPVWSTVLDLQLGDAVNIWLDSHLNTTLIWEDNQGAEGYRGLTLHVAQPGRPFASLTLPGFTRADAEASPELRHLQHFLGFGGVGEVYIGLSVNPYA
jgi:hypothetical protein